MKSAFTTIARRAASSGPGPFTQPPGANDLARAAGIASFMRMPVKKDAEGLDVAFLGVPFDSTASNRPGTRFGPRAIRSESVLLRSCNGATMTEPFDHVEAADVGDVPINPYNTSVTATRIESFLKETVLSHDCTPLTLGGDHFITYPILRAVADRAGGPVALIHVDAHSDTADSFQGEKLTHGTPFRRAHEDGLLVNDKVFQIGLRGPISFLGDYQWGRDQGWSVTQAHEIYNKSLVPLMKEIREKIGPSTPTYLTFDIDGIDPCLCPGTGTPEIGGLSIIQALEVVRGCAGLNIVGGDLVEVSPTYDTTGTTALTGANLVFEMLCVLPKVVEGQKKKDAKK